jgi:hypothetical protein
MVAPGGCGNVLVLRNLRPATRLRPGKAHLPTIPARALPLRLLLVIPLAIGAVPCRAQPTPVEVKSRCYDCHLNPDPPAGTKRGPFVDLETYHASVHGTHRCESCHRSVLELPHPQTLPPVECRDCHRVGNTAGAPQLKSYREYEQSVHGQLVAAGDPRAPRCQDCHGHHDILKPSDKSSHVNRLRIAETCGKCHSDVAAVYRKSSHGRSLLSGNLEAPVCTDCHGEHSILRPDQPGSSVSRAEVVNTCAFCHEDVARMELFGRDASQVESFRESYHGVAAQFGSTTTAVCVDCHGHHDIRGPDDPKSRIYPANLPATCGQPGCHEGAGAGFAKGKVHVAARTVEEGTGFTEGRDRNFAKVFRVVELAFIALTTSVIFGMILYMALDLFHRWVYRRGLWIRYLAVATVPLLVTFWAVYKVALAFIEKLRA